MAKDPMVRFERVEHRYAASRGSNNRAGLSEVSFEVLEGELAVVIGPSGSGKTTLLKLINRLLEPEAGRVLVGGVDVRQRDPYALRRSIGYVFQRFGLFPHLNLAENVGVGPRLAGWGTAEREARVDELLALLGLPPEEYRSRLPHELSGGQQQRVGLARALAARPRLMLMDEPFGSLDPVTRAELQGSYRRLHDELGLTTLLVTHDVVEALLLADRVLFLYGGRVLLSASPRELLSGEQPEPVAQLLEVPRRQMERLEQLVRG
jgi:osmoprotectant transport system ATP-binding protein